MGIINELGYKLRRSYVILLAIYYGNKKPPMQQFLKESFDELNILKKEGLYVNNIRYSTKEFYIKMNFLLIRFIIKVQSGGCSSHS